MSHHLLIWPEYLDFSPSECIWAPTEFLSKQNVCTLEPKWEICFPLSSDAPSESWTLEGLFGVEKPSVLSSLSSWCVPTHSSAMFPPSSAHDFFCLIDFNRLRRFLLSVFLFLFLYIYESAQGVLFWNFYFLTDGEAASRFIFLFIWRSFSTHRRRSCALKLL